MNSAACIRRHKRGVALDEIKSAADHGTEAFDAALRFLGRAVAALRTSDVSIARDELFNAIAYVSEIGTALDAVCDGHSDAVTLDE